MILFLFLRQGPDRPGVRYVCHAGLEVIEIPSVSASLALGKSLSITFRCVIARTIPNFRNGECVKQNPQTTLVLGNVSLRSQLLLDMYFIFFFPFFF